MGQNNAATLINATDADTIFMNTAWASQLDDCDTEADADGYHYSLVDGSTVIVGHDGKVTHVDAWDDESDSAIG